MAIQLLGATFADDGMAGASGTTQAVTRTVQPGSTLVVFCTWDSAVSGSPSCADTLNGSYGAALQSIDNGSSQQAVACFALVNTKAGSNTITVAWSGTAKQFKGIVVVEVVGAKLVSSIDNSIGQTQAAPGTGTDTLTSTAVANANQPALQLACVMNLSSGAVPLAGTGFASAGSGWSAGGGGAIVESKRIVTTTSVAATGTAATSTGGGNFTTIEVFVDEAPGVVPSGLVPFYMVGPGRLKGPRPQQSFVSPVVSGGDVTVALTGQSATASPGTLGVAMDVPATGSSATASPGTVTPASSIPISGQQATASPGTVTPNGDVTVALTGQGATASSGTLTPSSTVATTGASAAASAGSLVPSPSLALSGQAATTSAGSLTPSSAVPLTGSAATTGQGSLGVATTTPAFAPSANGRYLVDQDGAPFWIGGDSAWWAVNGLSIANATTYLDNRRAKGFTTLIVELLAIASSDARLPASQPGDLPFTTKSGGGSYTGTAGTADFSTPNDTYWAYVKSVVDLAAAKGFMVLAYVDFWGFGGSASEGCWTDLINAANTTTVCTAFGSYLANGHGAFGGFKSCPNLIFTDGGDYGDNNGTPPSSTGKTRALAIASGMQSNGCLQLRTFDGQSPSLATDQPEFTTECQVQAVYTYGGIFPTATSVTNALHTYQEARAAWNYTPTSSSQGPSGATAPPKALPAYLKETAYEHSSLTTPTATAAMVRKAQYWAWLSGCTAGVVSGNSNIWEFIDGTWQAALEDASALDMKRLNALIPTLRWWDLVPSELAIPSGGTMRLLVTSSNGTQTGTPDSYVAAAQTSDGKQLVAYVPTFSTGSQSLTLDLRSMAGNCRLRWWDPTAGTFQNVSGVASGFATPAATSSALAISTPGTNTAGDNDWFLIVDTQENYSIGTPAFMTVGPGRWKRPIAFQGSTAPNPDVTVALSGQATAISGGSLTPSAAVPVSGLGASTSGGTLAPSPAIALAGTALTTASGAMTPSADVPVPGQAVSASLGSLTASPALAISGSAATVSAGSMTPANSAPLPGNAVAASGGTLTSSETLALAGQQVVVQKGDVVASTPGGATLAGRELTTGSGTLSPSTDTALSGSAVTAQGGTVSPNVTVALVGLAIRVAPGRLTAPGGSTKGFPQDRIYGAGNRRGLPGWFTNRKRRG